MPGPGAGDSGCASVEDQATALVVVRDLGQDPEVVTASIAVLSDCAAAGAEASGWVRAARIPVAVMVRIGCLVMAACARLWAGKFDSQVMVASTVFLPGAPRVLRTLHEAGYRVGVVTTKYQHRVEDALDRAGLREFVEVIVGADDVPRPKPAPDGLLRAVDSLGIPAGDCVFVGDSEVDTRAAQAAGMAFVAVLSGTTTVEVFAGYPVRAVLDGVGEIVPAM